VSFTAHTQVRFGQVDAAGIVFYPRFFEMLNAAVEDWFAQGIGVDFATLHLGRGLGAPTVHLETDFTLPCRLGEKIAITLQVERLGERSATLAFVFEVAGEARLRGRVVLVCMALAEAVSVPWPDDIRAGMAAA